MAEPFILEEKIAQGGFGEVWRGRDAKRGEIVAVKFLRLDRAGPGFLGLFKREFEILSEIRHVHLARVFDFGFDSTRNLYYFTQEFCPGVSLKLAVQEHPEDFEEMLVQVLSALDYIHSQGVIHFDVKPENIIVTRDDDGPHAKLVDFGIAARLSALSGGRGGTLAYMAPELFQKNAAIDHRIDLYSLGMTILEVLAGGYPFDNVDPEEIIAWHQKGSVPPKMWEEARLPRYLGEIIRKLLQKKPSDRFSSAKVVLNFLNLSTGRKYLKEEEGLLGQIPTEGPLVERRAEVVDPLLERMKSPGLVTICGEKGIGKSRILDEVRHALELKELPICRIDGDWQIAAWPRLQDWLGLPALPESEMSEAWRIPHRIDAVVDAARMRPFCLLIDDAHKVDEEMKAFLKGLAERTRNEPAAGLSVLLSTEDVGEGPEADPSRILLRRISNQGISDYVRLVLGEAPGVEKLAGLLHQYSGGLPLLMVEGLRFLAPHAARGESLENLLPPPEVIELYRPAFEALTASERELLTVTALLFRPVAADELVAILKKTQDEVLADAASCTRKGLLAEGIGETGFRVSSQALGLGLIRSLGANERPSFHLKIAAGLQSRPSPAPREVAYHLWKGGEGDKAAAYFRQAAREFKERGQIASANESLVRAIHCVGEESQAGEELLLEAIRSLILAGEFVEASDYLKKLDSRPSLEREELKGWLAFKQRRFSDAREFYARALQSLPAGELPRRIQLENALANVDLQEGRPFEAAGRFRKTLEWEAKTQPADRVKISNNNLGLALSLMGDLTGAEAFYVDRIQRASGRMGQEEELACLSGLGYILLQSSRYGEAVERLSRATEIAERTGAMHSLFSSAGNLITALLKEGRYTESLPYLQKMVMLQQRLGTVRDVAFNLLRQGDVYLTLGMGEAARDSFQKGQKAAVEAGQKPLVAWFLLMEGYWEREFGERDRARQFFLQTELEAAKISQEDLITWAVFALADLAHDCGDDTESRRHLERIVPIKSDEDFAARFELITLKANPDMPDRWARFEALERKCIDSHFREILWELYESWGRAEAAEGRTIQAIQRFEQGIATVESIAASLPEEYRDRYLHNGGRQRLIAEYREMAPPQARGLSAKIKQLFHLH